MFTNLVDAFETTKKANYINGLDFYEQSKVQKRTFKNKLYQEPDSFIDHYFKNKIELTKLEIERNKQLQMTKQSQFIRQYPTPIILQPPDANSPCVIANPVMRRADVAKSSESNRRSAPRHYA